MAKGHKTGGRQKGSLNKATADIRELARQYCPEALAELGRLAREATSEQARCAAIKELLDRGYGKSTQPVELSGAVGTYCVEVPAPVDRDAWISQHQK